MHLSYGFKRNSFKLYHMGSNFFHTQWAGGVILLFFVVVAMLLANLPFTADLYHSFIEAPVGFTIGNINFEFRLEHLVNDGLMMIFFFTVGLEIKREIIHGHLSSFQKAILPVAGALGGMLAPAIIYSLFNINSPYASGWGIPMATDIAFAIAILSVVGNKVPTALKIFLTALAVADDLGAIIVIAIFYGSSINFTLLLIAALLLALAWLFSRLKVNAFLPYILISVGLWFLFYNSGVHATIAGVLLAMFVPSKEKYSKKYFVDKVKYFVNDFVQRDDNSPVSDNAAQISDIRTINHIAVGSLSLSQRFEYILSPWVNFVILPLFALVNAGVQIGSLAELNIFGTSQGMGILFGLWIGKPLGITLMSWLFVKLKLAVMPEGASWKMFAAVACMGGIGFTMSIFMDTLAFSGMPDFIASGKIAILAASIIAALTGYLAINYIHNRSVRPDDCATNKK